MTRHTLPKPIMKRAAWPYWLVWIVPILAAAGGGYFGWAYLQDRGPLVTVRFGDGSGLNPGDTPVRHRGVQIGTVTSVELGAEDRDVAVQVRLRRAAAGFARQGARFWVVRPEISAGSISGLATVVSGPYIDATPGTGENVSQFTGLERAPVSLGAGLQIVLYTRQLQHLQPDSGVYYRGIQVGVVKAVQLNDDATQVNLQVLVWDRYRPLVRGNSQFWILTGVDVKGGLLSGVKLEVDSLKALLAGGIAFATPPLAAGPAVKDGAGFALNDEAKKEWLDWAPSIAIKPDETEGKDKTSDLQAGEQAMKAAAGK